MSLFGILLFLFNGMGEHSILKDDLNVIRTYQKKQKSVELARQLNLTAEQITVLKDIKTQADRLKQEREKAQLAFEKQHAPFVKTIRETYEAGKQPDSQSLEKLKDLQRHNQMKRKEFQLQLQIAALPLENLLTREQKTQIAEISKERHKNKGPRPKTRNMKVIWAKILLSDTFMKAI